MGVKNYISIPNTYQKLPIHGKNSDMVHINRDTYLHLAATHGLTTIVEMILKDVEERETINLEGFIF